MEVYDKRVDGDVTRLIIAFRKRFANKPKNCGFANALILCIDNKYQVQTYLQVL